MPVLLKVAFDQGALDDVFLQFDRKNADMVITAALNDTAAQVKNEAARRVAEDGGFKVGGVKKAIAVHKAKRGDTQALVTASKRRPSLYSVSKKPAQVKAGVAASAWGQRKVYQGTFIARMPGGHVGIFKRKTFSRLPIAELWGPSIPRLMIQREIAAALEAMAGTRLRTNIARQIDRRLRSLAGKGRRSR